MPCRRTIAQRRRKKAVEIPYEDAVQQGKKIVERMTVDQWRLGELADLIEPKYGDQTLERFATAIGVGASTLKNYRAVYRAWKDIRPSTGETSFSVLAELAAHPDRAEIVARPRITEAEARQIMRNYRAGAGTAHVEQADDEGADAEERRWAGRLLLRANKAAGDAKFEDWSEYEVDVALVQAVKAAAQAWAECAEYVEKLNRRQHGAQNAAADSVATQ